MESSLREDKPGKNCRTRKKKRKNKCNNVNGRETKKNKTSKTSKGMLSTLKPAKVKEGQRRKEKKKRRKSDKKEKAKDPRECNVKKATRNKKAKKEKSEKSHFSFKVNTIKNTNAEKVNKKKRKDRILQKKSSQPDPSIVFSHSLYCTCKECSSMYLKGKWSKHECDIVMDNVRRIGGEYGVEDLASNLFEDVKLLDGKVMTWYKFTRFANFNEKVRAGLNRSVPAIKSHLYNTLLGTQIGKFSSEEIDALEKFHASRGNKWREISKQLGRCLVSVFRKWKKLGGNRGPWTDEETESLKKGIRKLTDTKEGTPVYKGINWDAVSRVVGTRNSHQCYMKWISAPKLALETSETSRWTCGDNMQLIEKVYASDALEECQLDFDEMFENWDGDSVVSPQLLLIKWQLIKNRYISDHKNMPFDDVVCELYHKHLPKLKSAIEREEKIIQETKECEEQKATKRKSSSVIIRAKKQKLQLSHQIKCGGNGYWSSPFMKCKTAGSCGVPPQIPGLKFTCSAYSLKATCKVTCTAKNYDAVVKGKEDIWGVSIACDSKLKWEPDPMLITCLKECRKDIGDGWCDEKNNNQHCRWDGGDCCASTTKDRMVRRSPPHCGKACDCLDPSALENRRIVASGDGNGPSPDDEAEGASGDQGNSPYRLEWKPSNDETKQ